MANKLVAVFLLSIVAAAAMHLTEASPVDDQYATCFNGCDDKCKSEGNGYSFCEMKCDADCLAKQAFDMAVKVRLSLAVTVFSLLALCVGMAIAKKDPEQKVLQKYLPSDDVPTAGFDSFMLFIIIKLARHQMHDQHAMPRARD
ncbi:hypothetical protein SADUNF_Sadunf05G0156700 [Salix dunnii]|uniref:Uncharacterized protein n=1 Tax=Salix dunnii TaxID=1413687 RepID=A0A835K285_9ROSI|nr:hypothetical protein SADUNF_Sadunf05G0156700 [Salix dunnii]